MRATVNRREVLDVLGKVKVAVQRRSLLPIADTILLHAENGELRLTATNLEATVIGSCKAKITKTGGICTLPKPLESFLKAVSAESVAFAYKSGGLRVEAGGDSMVFKGDIYSEVDFPPVPQVRTKKGIEFEELNATIGQIDFAMDQEDSRPILSATVFGLYPAKGGVELATADGFRLAITVAEAKGRLKEPVIVPRGTILMVKKLMRNKVIMTVDDDYVCFEGNGVKVVSKVVAGTFPKYKQLVPEGGSLLKTSKDEMLNALKVLAAIRPDNGIVRLVADGETLTMMSKNDDDKAEVKVACEGKVKIAFNLDYLKDVITRADETVNLWTTTPSAPGRFEVNSTTYVLMPMFVKW